MNNRDGNTCDGELPLVAGAQELKEPGGREGIRRVGIGRIGMGLDEGGPVSRPNARSRDRVETKRD